MVCKLPDGPLGKVKGGKRKLTCQLGSLATGKPTKLRVVVETKHAGNVKVRARVPRVLRTRT